ncbi:hypothetical protein D3C83_04330 [compost metagenome]
MAHLLAVHRADLGPVVHFDLRVDPDVLPVDGERVSDRGAFRLARLREGHERELDLPGLVTRFLDELLGLLGIVGVELVEPALPLRVPALGIGYPERQVGERRPAGEHRVHQLFPVDGDVQGVAHLLLDERGFRIEFLVSGDIPLAAHVYRDPVHRQRGREALQPLGDRILVQLARQVADVHVAGEQQGEACGLLAGDPEFQLLEFRQFAGPVFVRALVGDV